MPAPRGSGGSGTATFVVERTIPAPVDTLWSLWTTKAGLESWWGPEDVVLTVLRLDPRSGGERAMDQVYAPVAADPARRAEFEAAGVPTSVTVRGTFTEVVPLRLLAFVEEASYGKGNPAVRSETRVEFHTEGAGVRVVWSVTARSDPHWELLARANLKRMLLLLSERATSRAP
jgi:uncharacterized protein YndB with AHSA1/START domain